MAAGRRLPAAFVDRAGPARFRWGMDKRFFAAAAALAGLAGTLACGAPQAAGGGDGAAAPIPVSDELRAAGRTAYRKYCIQCHGYSGRGDGASAAQLDPPPRNHTDAEIMDGIGDRTIAETVRHGGTGRGFPGMPAFPHISDEEITALVAYVRSLSRPGVESIDLEGFR
jgi:mono/diheme cytochrome c family protein